MKNILVFGAGRSSSALINYLLNNATNYDWSVTVADANLKLARHKVKDHPKGIATELDVADELPRHNLVSAADLVISLLPPSLHYEVAKDCLRFEKNLLTASYVSAEIQHLDSEAREKGLLFMCELGLDPGIDHMSALKKIEEIKQSGGTLTAFRSYTGGLVAPESDNNPWHYKVSWNPRNVVLAGQGTARFLQNGMIKYQPYHRLFRDFGWIDVPGMGMFEVYPNRDSLHYRKIYGIEEIPTLIRGTIRHKGYCHAWNALISLGLTDSSFVIEDSENLSYRALIESFLPEITEQKNLEERVAKLLGIPVQSTIMDQLRWLGLFGTEKTGIAHASPAMILEDLILKKWKMNELDKDLIIMQHEFEYLSDGKKHFCKSTMCMTGKDAEDTAMAKLVGLPLGIFAKMMMLQSIDLTGVHIPVMREVYEPVLAELSEFGLHFLETKSEWT